MSFIKHLAEGCMFFIFSILAMLSIAAIYHTNKYFLGNEVGVMLSIIYTMMLFIGMISIGIGVRKQ